MAALILILVGIPFSCSLAFASIVDYKDESEKEEECKEEAYMTIYAMVLVV